MTLSRIKLNLYLILKKIIDIFFIDLYNRVSNTKFRVISNTLFALAYQILRHANKNRAFAI